ncbi:hypothetical protein HZU77_006885 [Neisseriaceae bacterium TC5R-5]|nr:hypothetical protein [Neisseriaceae bacterium TC5R-5]
MSLTTDMFITHAGHTALWNAQNTGVSLALTHVSFGDGRQTPTGEETALLSVRQTVPIAGGSRITDTQIRLRAQIPGTTYYEVCEIGIWAGDPAAGGKLFAYYAVPDGVIMYVVEGISAIFAYDFTVAQAVGDHLTILADAGQSAVLALLSEHEAAANPHPQYVTREQLELRFAGSLSDNYATKSDLSGKANTATTLAGYGITDGATKTDLNKKANIDSPRLTGTPISPTPPRDDNSGKIATTQFVMEQRGLYSPTGAYLAPGEYPVSSVAGASSELASTFNKKSTFTFLIDDNDYGRRFELRHTGENSISEIMCGNSGLFFVGGSFVVESVSLKFGDVITLVVTPSGLMIANLFSAHTPSLLTQNGYRLLPAYPGDPNPLIMQWCTSAIIAAGRAGSVNFPYAFPNQCLWALANVTNTDSYNLAFNVVCGATTQTRADLFNCGTIGSAARILALGN